MTSFVQTTWQHRFSLPQFLPPIEIILLPDKNESALLAYLFKKGGSKSVIEESEEVKWLNFSEKVRFKGGSSNFTELHIPVGFHW